MNAKVDRIFIGISEHGLVTARIYFDLADGCSQGSPYKNLGGEYLARFVKGICDTFEVSNILDIVGKPCVISGSDTRIDSVYNFLNSNKKYDF